ncbi:MAG: site-specific DNA-methyltransferase [Pseudomonadota bacterium]
MGKSKEKAAPADIFPSYKTVPLADLRPFKGNARTHSPEQIDQIAASIKRFGFTNPLLITPDGDVIAGHGRLAAARKLRMDAVPCVEIAGLSVAERRALIIADNKLALNAGWDLDMLRIELGDLKADGFDLALTGFSIDELGEMFSEAHDGLTDPDDAPEAPATPVSKLGDLWVLGNHRLACGDSTDATVVERLLGTVKPNLMVTDPPYGVEYDPSWRADRGINKSKEKMGKVLNDDRADWSPAWALFPGDVAYVWCASMFNDVVITSLESCGFERRSHIIWSKDRFTLGRGHYHWQHEPCWYVVRGSGHWNGDRSQSTIWNIKARDDAGHGHGTQKPVECMKRPIENNSSPGQAIYEPFSGSGTTLIACEMTGRIGYAIELDPAYIDVAVKRWQAFTGKLATLDGDGRTFDEIAAERV